jgi:hypothetical protein
VEYGGILANSKGIGCGSLVIGLIAIGLIVSAVSSSFDDLQETQTPSRSSAQSETPSPTSTPVPTLKTFESEGCIPVSEELLESISLGINFSKITGRAAGHNAPDFGQLTFVAVEFIPNGTSDPQIAVFATNDDDISDQSPNGLTFSVDAFATGFSDWGEMPDAEFSMSSRGAREAKDCISLPGASLAEPPPAPSGFDEAQFIRLSGENFNVFDQTYDDGSTSTVMGTARRICDASLATIKSNLGSRWESSYQKFAIESLCPEKLG